MHTCLTPRAQRSASSGLGREECAGVDVCAIDGDGCSPFHAMTTLIALSNYGGIPCHGVPTAVTMASGGYYRFGRSHRTQFAHAYVSGLHTAGAAERASSSALDRDRDREERADVCGVPPAAGLDHDIDSDVHVADCAIKPALLAHGRERLNFVLSRQLLLLPVHVGRLIALLALLGPSRPQHVGWLLRKVARRRLSSIAVCVGRGRSGHEEGWSRTMPFTLACPPRAVCVCCSSASVRSMIRRCVASTQQMIRSTCRTRTRSGSLEHRPLMMHECMAEQQMPTLQLDDAVRTRAGLRSCRAIVQLQFQFQTKSPSMLAHLVASTTTPRTLL